MSHWDDKSSVSYGSFGTDSFNDVSHDSFLEDMKIFFFLHIARE